MGFRVVFFEGGRGARPDEVDLKVSLGQQIGSTRLHWALLTVLKPSSP